MQEDVHLFFPTSLKKKIRMIPVTRTHFLYLETTLKNTHNLTKKRQYVKKKSPMSLHGSSGLRRVTQGISVS